MGCQHREVWRMSSRLPEGSRPSRRLPQGLLSSLRCSGVKGLESPSAVLWVTVILFLSHCLICRVPLPLPRSPQPASVSAWLLRLDR